MRKNSRNSVRKSDWRQCRQQGREHQRDRVPMREKGSRYIPWSRGRANGREWHHAREKSRNLSANAAHAVTGSVVMCVCVWFHCTQFHKGGLIYWSYIV